MHTNRLSPLFSLFIILAIILAWLPASASLQTQTSTILIDGIKDSAWSDPIASDPAGDMTEPNLDLQRLFVLEDTDNYYIGFDATASTWGMAYGIYIDSDRIDGSGGTFDPWDRAINAVSAHLPEHTIYVWHSDNDTLESAQLNHWNGLGWSYDSLVSQGGDQAYGPENDWIEYRVPKSALGNPSHIAIELFTTGGNGHAQDTAPSDPKVAYTSPDWSGDVTSLSAFALLPKPTWYLWGEFNGWTTSDPMFDDGTHGDAAGGDGIFTSQIVVPTPGRYLFKVANQDWSTSHPTSGDSWLNTSSEDEAVTITFDTNAHEDGWLPQTNIIGVSTDPAAWTAVGDWQGWDNANETTRMDSLENGIYQFTVKIPAPGIYQFKAANTGSWDAIGADGRSVNAENAAFETTELNQNVNFTVDAFAGRIMVEVELVPPRPKPDNEIWWDGLSHDSRDDLYRVPGGAITTGTPATLRFRTYKNDVTSVVLRVWSTSTESQTLYPMTKLTSSEEPPYGYDYWQVTLPGQDQPTILWYRFIVRDGTDEDYYEDDDLFDGGWGAVYEDSPDFSFQINVYTQDFQTPEWMHNAVVYQVFPDRFYNGDFKNDPQRSDPAVYGNEIVVKTWEDLPEGYCRNYFEVACGEGPLGRDFFGGDLEGIIQKLGYLKSLGVTAIYINPIFMAPSNHLYDTTNYQAIDPYFGSTDDFERLIEQAEKKGIRVILDGVFNHTSSDSLYFDKQSKYSGLGAFESQGSPYFDWYNFFNWPEEYNSWFGFDTLPVLTEIQEVRDFIYANQDSVARHWIGEGADGWRLDVANEKSHDWWQEFRPRIKSVNSDALILGELWDDASPWLLGDQFDSAMNYRFRRALIGFINGDTNDPNQGFVQGLNPDQFNNVLQSIKEDYPAPAFNAAMNLVGSHDTQRILWVLTPGERNRQAKEFNSANLSAGKNKLKLLAILQMTLPGAPTIYYGDEVGLTGDTDPDDRRTYPWENRDTDLMVHYKKLIHLRNQYSFLRTGSFDRLYTHNDHGLYAYGRKDASGAAVVLVNRDTTSQSATIDLLGYIPNGTELTDKLTGLKYTLTEGQITVEVPGLWGAILVTPLNTDLTPPDAPTGLATEERISRVDLSWEETPDAAGYNLYRSLVTSGGYQRLNDQPLRTTSYSDQSVINGKYYYYVVTAVDQFGNESPRSQEVRALPHLIIGWANLQWPPEIQHTLSAINPTGYIYGQVWIDGFTDQRGPTEGLIAQVGFGPDGSNPANNPEWVWVDAEFNVDVGNNDEFKGQLLPEVAGNYDYAYRYSTTAGLDWVYADLDGISNGYDSSATGVLNVTPSDDTTPPGTPGNLRLLEAGSSFIALAWDSVPDADLFRYDVYRRSTRGDSVTKMAEVLAPDTHYSDWTVETGETYLYSIRAVDSAFNKSNFSSELEATAKPRLVQVTFNAALPDTTPEGDDIYIAGNFNGWNPAGTKMTRDRLFASATIDLEEGAHIEYKYTRGSWTFVEKGAECEEIDNRNAIIEYSSDGSMTINDNVLNWRNTGTCGD